MKLIRAEFENFRLLRRLDLDFSTDEKLKLTVIRAENETGKTTILNGLQWALYGDDALPGKGEDYRLHPIDWDASESNRVTIAVQVEFETTELRRSPRGLIENKKRYRIIRSTFETLNGAKWDRTPSTVKLFYLSETGSKPIDPPEAIIEEELPPELRDVFFTDGDRALSFIEASISASTKRDRVQKAVRSLLGLRVIEDALKHVKKTAAEVNKSAKENSTDAKIIQITSNLEQNDKEIMKLEVEIEDAKLQFAAFDEKISDTQKKIEAGLIKGDREELKQDIDKATTNLKRIKSQQEVAEKEHSDLFRGLALSRDLLAPVLIKPFLKLSELHDLGKIPNSTIPVLEDRLNGSICICGESLQPDDKNGQRRRAYINSLIDVSRKADALQGQITDLYFGSRPLQPDQVEVDERWLTLYKKVVKRRDGLEIMRKEQGTKLKALEAQLDGIPNTDIQGLREVQRQFTDQRDRFNSIRVRSETKLELIQKEQAKFNQEYDNLLREKKKGNRILAERNVIQDIERVLNNSYGRITNEELEKVSTLMNKIFLEMIGADPQQGAIIRRAVISKDFDIVVYGPNERTLNPDRDLNGASRRALTLAFILALTKVSEVEAPNVIDTPLGMMSGFVKKSVLKTAIRESSQLILFLTRSEISDCEDILDDEAGRVITLTNPTHYPRMLLNDPKVHERTVLRCECTHRQECKLCRRRMDVDTSLENASQEAVRDTALL